MCPTTLGRIETRVATITLPAIFATILSLVQWRPSWIALIGLYLLLGVALDVLVYSWLLRYQPPWMTFVLAVAEFGLLYVLVVVLDDIDLSLAETIAVYWVSWVLAIWTKSVALPILSLTYLEAAAVPAPAPGAEPAAGGSRGEVPEPVPEAIERELEATGAARIERPFQPEGPRPRRTTAARRGWMIAYSYALVLATIGAEF